MNPDQRGLREAVSREAGSHDRPLRRAFLTGATGFLGRRVARELLARGVDVHASRHHAGPQDVAGMTWHGVDLASPQGVREVIETVHADVLVHLAWDLSGDYQTSSENQAWVGWSLDLAREFVRAGGRRILVAGSCAEYEWSGAPLSEESPCHPATPYGTAKLLLYRELQSLYGDSVTVLWPRLFFLFGEGERPQRVIPHLIRDVASGRDIDWISPQIRRDFLHADEAAAAMIHLLVAGAEGPVNVASGTAPTIRQIAQIVATALGRDRPGLPSAAVNTGPLEIRADVTRLGALGWVPRRTVGAALTSLCQASVQSH